ncbi:DUF4132 domain-containing protein [Actinomadura sp. KC216]|uniref:DUF4132 domain-containing protein n=1 Tax=Actinomadura sp. KC216 TaxID=2530370 RepID=UPI0010468D53|nr:DUF4132 domain-containing protein [Actinomadura sp. KC216]TDB83909.1 DUF4132 domain-containing protein [Actinomadura sp. KC216]
MDLAARLLRALTDPAPEDAEFRPSPHDLAQLSDEELGTLTPAAYSASGLPTSHLRIMVQDEYKGRRSRYTPDACRRLFDTLVTGLDTRKWADLTLGASALVRCTGPWPDVAVQARTLVTFLMDGERTDQAFALLAIAGLAGDDLVAAVAERLRRDDPGPIRLEEIDTLTRLTTAERLLATELAHSLSRTPIPDVWERLSEVGPYIEFARRALEVAAARARAIQTGEIPYRADGAFTTGEVGALGRAARLALHRDEPWLPSLFDTLLLDIAVAPTRAKTLPSQALLYEIARAAQDFPTPELVTAIRTVRRTARHAGVPKQLDKMLKKIDAALAERTDVALRLPGLGFGPDGTLRRPLGEHTAVVTVAGKAELAFEKDGTVLKGVPAAVRRDHKDEVKELRDLVKRVGAQIATLVRAVEGGYTVDATHPFGRWRDTLVNHPIAGPAVRRLIWEIEVAPGEWRSVLPEAGALPDAAGDAPVRLWHPLRSDPDTVRAWRDLLVDRRIRQPFKQAFREIYLLTPAEEETGTYSNRFAAHLVHYRRLFALFRARGWTSRLLGPWDGGDADEAARTLAAGEWRIRLSHVLADWEGEEPIAGTGRVRFARRVGGAWRDAPLADVPPLVFSEAMRDVDLFVGVTSIATDDMWEDGEAHAYWVREWYADPAESTRTRRDALERVLPRTKIADRCSTDGRYLTVRGRLRTYKIHLRSANVVMEPDDAFLCIIPERRKAAPGRVFLPFEEELLSLILSKAFLLAADDEITDESILLQIKRGA